MGFESKLWHAADKMRGHVDAAKLEERFAESAKLERAIRENMKLFGG